MQPAISPTGAGRMKGQFDVTAALRYHVGGKPTAAAESPQAGANDCFAETYSINWEAQSDSAEMREMRAPTWLSFSSMRS
jgi:hypothetical protein